MFRRKGKQRQLVAGSLRTVGTMIAGGLPLPAALQCVADLAIVVAPLRWPIVEEIWPSPGALLKRTFLRMRQDIEYGSTLAEALRRAFVLTMEEEMAIHRGEVEGNLPVVLMGRGARDETVAETDSAIVQVVNKMLLDALNASVDAISYPTLPEGEVAVAPSSETSGAREPVDDAMAEIRKKRHEKLAAKYRAEMAELLGFDAATEIQKDTCEAQPRRSDGIFCFRKGGVWTEYQRVPGRNQLQIMNRMLVMAKLPHWSKKMGEGVIRLRTGGKEIREFRLHHDPAAPRVLLEVVR